MRQSQQLFLVFLSALLWSCQERTTSKPTITTATKNAVTPKTTDTLTIDLVALQKQGKLLHTTVITINDDPVYHSVKHFNAFPLQELLNTYPAIRDLDATKYQIVFECEDGYKPVMPLQQFLSKKSYLSVSDVDAPKGELWSKIIKDGHEMIAAPFYLIYEDVSTKETDFKWPYNLIKIHFVDTASDSSLYPNDNEKAQVGFELFKKNCITCHAINTIGGKMGPELNYPKSVTEYWDKNQLKGFIKNPAAFRNAVKMPTLTHLTEKEIEDITVYLAYMANHKS